jgi:hypothetical protein
MATGPEAGWYDDGSGKQRWWDGVRWTEQFIDLHERYVDLHTGVPPASTPVKAGWYDDGRGRHRWWDGRHWTNAFRFSGEEEEFAGVVVDGRWIHFGQWSHPVAGAAASFVSGAELLKKGRLSKPSVARVLFGPAGLITPRMLAREVRADMSYLLIEVGGQVWLTPVAYGQDVQARIFTTWINNVSEHYRYR